MISDQIRPATLRQTVQVQFADGQVFEGPVGTPLEVFVRAAFPDESSSIMAALVNGKLCELTCSITRDADVLPISMTDSDGMRIYRRSLSFLLVTAVHELHPDARIVIDYAVPLGGFFCQVEGREPFTAEEVALIERRMWEIVEADAPISKERVAVTEAMALFGEEGYNDKVRLLKDRRKDYLKLYTLRGVKDYFYGYMVPSTGYLRTFHLRHHPPGFILQYPTAERPTALPEHQDYPKLTAAFREYGQWMKVMKVDSVASLNEAIETGRIREVILVAEALHEERIATIAHQIAEQEGQVRLVLIAGPSGSGKTTFSKRLSVQLMAHEIWPVPLGLDNYFVDREKTPLDEHGQHDFETINALDLPLFNEQLLALIAGQQVTLPRYNFKTGKREWGRTLSISDEHVILVEGIHGLNPDLVPNIPPEQIYRIYVSALTQLNIDHHNRISTSDTRLLRRIVRDAAYRGYSVQETIKMWGKVRRGEWRNIFPFQENADALFNSALVYELAVLKSFAEPLLRQVEPGTMEYVEVKRLLAFLDWFISCGPDLIPDNSILREFIGGSILRDFSPTLGN
ncbi:MAG TPA: nucleoside kinase [Anaerolineae bacterium]|nr:nucleoside kinase [Anaerolineae bacterium]